MMAKVRTTVTLEEEVLKGVKVRAARSGRGDSEVIEEMLRRELGLDVLEQLWSSNRLPEKEAIKIAVEAQHAARRRRSR
jgi:metal-responsive CopG/Arc/MetJ family transcriptional regulator